MLKTPRTLRLNTFKKNWNWTCLILLTASFHEFSKVNGRFDEFLKNFDMILLFTWFEVANYCCYLFFEKTYLSYLSVLLGQGPLITDGRNSNEMLILRTGLVGYPWHFKNNEDIITKFEWHGLQIIKINRKKFNRSDITPSYFLALMKMVIFSHFSQYRAKG